MADKAILRGHFATKNAYTYIGRQGKTADFTFKDLARGLLCFGLRTIPRKSSFYDTYVKRNHWKSLKNQRNIIQRSLFKATLIPNWFECKIQKGGGDKENTKKNQPLFL